MEHFWEPSWQWGSALCHLSPVARIMGHFSEVEFCNVGSQGRGLYLWLTISKFWLHLTFWCQYCLNLSSQKITIPPPKTWFFIRMYRVSQKTLFCDMNTTAVDTQQADWASSNSLRVSMAPKRWGEVMVVDQVIDRAVEKEVNKVDTHWTARWPRTSSLTSL